jgi:SAM-dependent methyltransferase
MSEFDKFAGKYEDIHAENIKASGYAPSYFDELKIREIYGCLKSEGKEAREMKFLNFGCGIGKSERYIRKYFPGAMIYSVDVSGESVKAARERNKDLEGLRFETFDGFNIPFEVEFDVIFIANVLHHVPFERHLLLLKNLCGSLAEKGALFLFEHNPLNPLTVRAVNSCEFDKDARLLNPLYTRAILTKSGFSRRKVRFVIFFPRLLSYLSPCEKYLRKVPFGAQYYYIAKKS